MGLKVYFSTEREDNEQLLWRGIGSVSCADADKVLGDTSSATNLQVGFRAGKCEELSHRASSFFISRCALRLVCGVTSWSWRGEGARREKVEKLGGKKEGGTCEKGTSKGASRVSERMTQRKSRDW